MELDPVYVDTSIRRWQAFTGRVAVNEESGRRFDEIEKEVAMKKDDEGPEKKNDHDSYEVGYGKPPKGTQFKKGESGNPKGRPKGKLNTSTVILRTFGKKIRITENERTREVTKFEAGIIQVANKGVRGDLHAVKISTPLVQMAEAEIREASGSSDGPAAAQVVSPNAYILAVRRALGYYVTDEEIEQAAQADAEAMKRPRRLTSGRATDRSVTDVQDDEE
jgi:hypothetical protein